MELRQEGRHTAHCFVSEQTAAWQWHNRSHRASCVFKTLVVNACTRAWLGLQEGWIFPMHHGTDTALNLIALQVTDCIAALQHKPFQRLVQYACTER